MTNYIYKITNFFEVGIWEIDLKTKNIFLSILIKFIRLIYATAKEFRTNELDIRAAGLVYSTLLALAPLLAFSFSVLKAFGVHNQLQNTLDRFLEPFGERGVEVTQKIIQFVDNLQVGVLGTIGLVLLIVTVVMLIEKIEQAVNYVWKIDKPRSLARRFSDYMSLILLGPVLIFSALGIQALILRHPLMEQLGLSFLLGQMLPFLFLWFSFSFIIIFVPNTNVKITSALLGGFISSITWQLSVWLFSSFIVNSPKYIAIYSSFASLFLFILWLYVNWLIVLIGSEVAFCYQNIDYISLKADAFSATNKFREKLAFSVMYIIGYNFYHKKPKLNLNDLSSSLGLPSSPVDKAVTQLIEGKLLHETIDDPPAYLPSISLENIKLIDVLNLVRTNRVTGRVSENRMIRYDIVEQLMGRVDKSIKTELNEENLLTLITSSQEVQTAVADSPFVSSKS